MIQNMKKQEAIEKKTLHRIDSSFVFVAFEVMLKFVENCVKTRSFLYFYEI